MLFLIWSLVTMALVMAERNRTMSASAAEPPEAIPASRPSPRNWSACGTFWLNVSIR
jgi:hypothetical protein